MKKPKNRRHFIIAESVYNWTDIDDPAHHDACLLLDSPQFVRKDIVFKHGLRHVSQEVDGYNLKILYNTQTIITGIKSPSDLEREKFWRSSCFHEFVQRPLKNKDERPTNADYQLGASLILPLVNILQPSIIVFLGSDLHKVNPIAHELGVEVDWPWDKFEIDGSIGKAICFKYDGRKKCKIICINLYYS